MPSTRNPERRRFLKTLGAGTAVAGAAGALGHVTLAQADANQRETRRVAPSREYRETAHIRAFYATLRD